jgi:hypothetical protein
LATVSPGGDGHVAPSHLALIKTCVSQRQAANRDAAYVLGQRLFSEPAEAFAGRLRLYWSVAAAGGAGPD